tara:strand:+ start:10 stop:702 length:693 start_codon:yes stop_codon:yes gene_type:complete
MSEDNSQNASEGKEVTLKPAEGSAPPAPAPPAPSPGAPPTPAPPAAPAAPAAPSPPQATQPLKPAEPAAQPTGAKTVPLSPTPASSSPSQATVKLQPSSPSAPSLPGGASAPLSTGKLSATLDDDGEESGVKPLAIACLILAIIALAIEGFTTDKIAEAASPNAEVGLLDIPNNDYNRAFKFEDGENELSFKFLRYSPDTKQDPPRNIFENGVDENLPIKDYETFKNEQN